MLNPWSQLPNYAPYVLPLDLEQINSYNMKASDQYKIETNILPEPYLGNLDEAKVILLNLNPGFDKSDIVWHKRDDFYHENRRNLIFQSDPPFYLLNQKFRGSGGFKWWFSHLRQFIDVFGIEKVAKDFMCIEYFPYHSVKYKIMPTLPSQLYSFHLIEEGIRLNKKIIIMRGKKLWLSSVKHLLGYNFITLNSNQNVSVSRNNLPNREFEKLVELLSQPATLGL